MADEIRVSSQYDADGSLHSPTDQQLRRWEEEGGRGTNMNPDVEPDLGPEGRVPRDWVAKIKSYFAKLAG